MQRAFALNFSLLSHYRTLSFFSFFLPFFMCVANVFCSRRVSFTLHSHYLRVVFIRCLFSFFLARLLIIKHTYKILSRTVFLDQNHVVFGWCTFFFLPKKLFAERYKFVDTKRLEQRPLKKAPVVVTTWRLRTNLHRVGAHLKTTLDKFFPPGELTADMGARYATHEN